MRILTRSRPETQPKALNIPKKIQYDITEKGFHLYKWISPEEVKLSIERDFLRVLKYSGIPLAIIAGLASIMSGLSIWVFIATILIGVCFILLYLGVLSLRRSFLLSKSAFVVLTDSSISLGGKVQKLSDIGNLHEDIKDVAETFEEDLFGESQLSRSKDGLMRSVMSQLTGGYKTLLKMFDNRGYSRSKDSAQGALVLIGLYTAYIAIMGIVYFLGVFGLLLFGNLLVWTNKKYLIFKGQNVLKINEHFGNIDILSDEIQDEKHNLKKSLHQAQKREWKDGLLLEINAGIENINNSASHAVEEVIQLRKEIQNSPHSDMFSFPIYNNWIKKQIATPLSQILELMQSTRDTLTRSLKELSGHLENQNESEYEGALSLQKKRIQSQIEQIDTFTPILENALDNLQKSHD